MQHPFPLPVGHVFGPAHGPLHWHDGRESLLESRWLAVWQSLYRQKFNRRLRPDQFSPTYDGLLQQLVIDVQRRTGQPTTGLLDMGTWDATWLYERPANPRPEVAKEKTGGRQLRPQSKKSWHYWRRFSNYQVQYGTDPDAPPWYPGRPFGRHEKGWHVREVQQLLGIKETGTYNADTQARVRGLQRLADLPVSGIVDRATAAAIDPGPWEDHPDAAPPGIPHGCPP